MTLDPHAYIEYRLQNTRPALSFADYAGTPEAWQAELRQRFDAVLGNLSQWERPPLDPQVTDAVTLDGYRRERVTFTSRPGLTAMGYYLIPDGIRSPRPAVLCLPGHGPGADSDVGIRPDGTQRRRNEPEGYSADFPLQCVSEGYPTFVLEQISFGNRKDGKARALDASRSDNSASSCTRDSMAALMLGESIPGWRVWDALRALDYLTTRAEVDPERLVTMGISGGGLTSLFTAALDTRVAACVVSGYLNTFTDSILSIDHCVDNYAPGLYSLAEMPDIAGLVAPRLLYAESGQSDPIFPLAAFEKAAGQVRRIYAALRVPDRFVWSTFDGGHRFDGAGAFPFLRERLAPRGF